MAPWTWGWRGLDPAVEDFGEARHRFQGSHGKAGLDESLECPGRGDDLYSQFVQAFGELDDPGLVRHRDQRPLQALRRFVRGRLRDELPILDLGAAFGEQGDGARIDPMLLGEHARGQGSRRVGGEDGHGRLQDDRSVVVLLVDDVDRRAADLYARGDRGFVHLPAVHPLTAEGG